MISIEPRHGEESQDYGVAEGLTAGGLEPAPSSLRYRQGYHRQTRWSRAPIRVGVADWKQSG